MAFQSETPPREERPSYIPVSTEEERFLFQEVNNTAIPTQSSAIIFTPPPSRSAREPRTASIVVASPITPLSFSEPPPPIVSTPKDEDRFLIKGENKGLVRQSLESPKNLKQSRKTRSVKPLSRPWDRLGQYSPRMDSLMGRKLSPRSRTSRRPVKISLGPPLSPSAPLNEDVSQENDDNQEDEPGVEGQINKEEPMDEVDMDEDEIPNNNPCSDFSFTSFPVFSPKQQNPCYALDGPSTGDLFDFAPRFSSSKMQSYSTSPAKHGLGILKERLGGDRNDWKGKRGDSLEGEEPEEKTQIRQEFALEWLEQQRHASQLSSSSISLSGTDPPQWKEELEDSLQPSEIQGSQEDSLRSLESQKTSDYSSPSPSPPAPPPSFHLPEVSQSNPQPNQEQSDEILFLSVSDMITRDQISQVSLKTGALGVEEMEQEAAAMMIEEGRRLTSQWLSDAEEFARYRIGKGPQNEKGSSSSSKITKDDIQLAILYNNGGFVNYENPDHALRFSLEPAVDSLPLSPSGSGQLPLPLPENQLPDRIFNDDEARKMGIKGLEFEMDWNWYDYLLNSEDEEEECREKREGTQDGTCSNRKDEDVTMEATRNEPLLSKKDHTIQDPKHNPSSNSDALQKVKRSSGPLQPLSLNLLKSPPLISHRRYPAESIGNWGVKNNDDENDSGSSDRESLYEGRIFGSAPAFMTPPLPHHK